MIMKISTLFANKRTRVIVIVAAVVLVLAILTPILLYAGGYIMPFDADGTPSARLLNTIKRDYAAHYARYGSSCSATDVTISYCGGYYNGCVPVFVDSPAFGYMQVVTKETIGGVRFSYSDSHTLKVWRFGKIYTVSEAYENGWLNQDDLYEIRDGFYAYRESLR